ncbi:MAG: helix-turn-helix domain-containing protein [Deltaproteobacteria bacterium]|nr:helix-turn-helix domain-containing protein [Deltaproteobacteria bacterium]
MEKICIVKRRKKETRTIDDRTPSITGFNMREAGGSAVLSSSSMPATIRWDEAEDSPPEVRASESDQILSFELTPEQSEMVQSNQYVRALLNQTSGNLSLDVHQGESGQLILNFYVQKAHAVTMLKPDEVCRMLQVSKWFLMKLVREKQMRSYKMGRRRRFSLEDVLEYLARSEEVKSYVL